MWVVFCGHHSMEEAGNPGGSLLSRTCTVQEQLSSHVTFVCKYQKNSITTEELQHHRSSAHVMFSRFSILGL